MTEENGEAIIFRPLRDYSERCEICGAVISGRFHNETEFREYVTNSGWHYGNPEAHTDLICDKCYEKPTGDNIG